ncbi:MAG: hypothetical protein DRR42_17575 [Gammaproteobacteria bacterium]|nr:MAG: hypothetical protein DRR42_17575 [Gammaproteobacteria bacterium]
MAERIAFDTSVLTFLINPDAQSRHTGLSHKKERISGLLRDLRESGNEVLIPSPVLGEILEGATPQASANVMSILKSSRQIEIAGFGELEALEYASLMAEMNSGNRPSDEPKRKMKFDSQILAICSTRQVTKLYVDDDKLEKRARDAGIQVLSLKDIPIPESEKQNKLPLKIVD